MAWAQLRPLSERQLHEMPSIAPLQCLFCRHLNPAGASFCNDCGSQLNLQPCEQCGAIDDRAATNCYKCGAEFTSPAAPGLNAPLALTTLENQRTYPALNSSSVAGPPAALPMDEAASPEMRGRATGSRRGTLVAVPVLVLTLLAAFVYYYGRSGQPGPLQDVQQVAPAVSTAPTPARSMPSVEVKKIDTAVSPTDTPPTRATGTVAAAKTPSPVPATVGTALPVRLPSASSAEVTTRQDPPLFDECPQAVAALGLCHPGPTQEK
ncbi:MAG: hypothetical protein GZ093_10510 [Rhodoferax sp.]|nr:hypothetical protein [Rhodoferax sp.]